MSLMHKVRKKKARLLGRLFDATLGRLPYYRAHAPGIRDLGHTPTLVRRLLAEERERLAAAGVERPRLLDVGARAGERRHLAEGYEYVALDIEPRGDGVIVGDICHCPEIPDASFDVVMSFDVLEHVKRPWDAVREIVRILKPGGLTVHKTPFAWRYHPCPVDYWRFSADGLEYLFSMTGEMETVLKGYDLTMRRFDKRGEDISSRPPIDYLGGFRENWVAVYVGRRKRA